ncbi:O-antigen ligase family protein [Enterocloster aldenensis]|uniref:O-antigen ligase family protein n=1 Tax=Enterocloster aldenensis TaxID=358742 RepID=UPI0040262EBD
MENQIDNSKEKNGRLMLLKKILSLIASVMIISILSIFPLYYRNYYFDILDAKYQFYYFTIIGLIIIAILTMIIIISNGEKRDENRFTVRILEGLRTIRLNSPQTWVLMFLGFCVISTFQSEYFYEAFWGNEGRYTGMFLLMLYVVSFLFVGKFFKSKQWYLDLFLISAMLVCLFGISDYFKLNLFHFKDEIALADWPIYTSTFGNINTYNAYVGLVFGCCSALYMYEKKFARRLYYFLCLIITFYSLITGGSDNAYLALLALFGLMPFWAFRSWKGIKDYFVMLATFFTIIYIAGYIHIYMGDRVEWLEGLFRILVESKFLIIVVAFLWCWVFGLNLLQKYSRRDLGNIPRLLWMILILIIIGGIAFVLYDANIAGNASRYGNLQRYVYFDDNWGTQRGMVWRIAVDDYINKFTHSQKLFGYGPDTFGIMTNQWNNEETLRKTGVIYDSAHNEYLQYLVTIGPFGLISYLGMIITSLLKMLRNCERNPYVFGAFFAIVCYSAQALVNINVPIAAPIMWMMLSFGVAEPKYK